jgi:hypothetical protein
MLFFYHFLAVLFLAMRLHQEIHLSHHPPAFSNDLQREEESSVIKCMTAAICVCLAVRRVHGTRRVFCVVPRLDASRETVGVTGQIAVGV